MRKHVFYTYLGTNGTITSMVHLEDIYYVRSIEMIADPGMVLTKDGKNFTTMIRVPEEEVDEWREVPGQI